MKLVAVQFSSLRSDLSDLVAILIYTPAAVVVIPALFLSPLTIFFALRNVGILVVAVDLLLPPEVASAFLDLGGDRASGMSLLVVADAELAVLVALEFFVVSVLLAFGDELHDGLHVLSLISVFFAVTLRPSKSYSHDDKQKENGALHICCLISIS
ncbi:hypothetical protein X975_01423, partial [Stegodyphus mimosarum]